MGFADRKIETSLLFEIKPAWLNFSTLLVAHRGHSISGRFSRRRGVGAAAGARGHWGARTQGGNLFYLQKLCLLTIFT